MSSCGRSDTDHGASLSDLLLDTTDQWSVGGYLSSWVAVETGVGLASCPWLIDVAPGRRVNISVLSPSARWPVRGGGGGAAISGCEWTVVIGEGNLTTHLSGCEMETSSSSSSTPAALYTSHQRGVPLAVQLSPTTTTHTPTSHILLYFQGTPPPPS